MHQQPKKPPSDHQAGGVGGRQAGLIECLAGAASPRGAVHALPSSTRKAWGNASQGPVSGLVTRRAGNGPQAVRTCMAPKTGPVAVALQVQPGMRLLCLVPDFFLQGLLSRRRFMLVFFVDRHRSPTPCTIVHSHGGERRNRSCTSRAGSRDVASPKKDIAAAGVSSCAMTQKIEGGPRQRGRLKAPPF